MGTISEIGLPIPILCKCPHGGKEPLDDSWIRHEKNYRSSCVCCEKFETDRYRRTKELNPAVADRDFNISVKMFLNKLVYTQKSKYDM